MPALARAWQVSECERATPQAVGLHDVAASAFVQEGRGGQGRAEKGRAGEELQERTLQGPEQQDIVHLEQLKRARLEPLAQLCVCKLGIVLYDGVGQLQDGRRKDRL